VHLTQTVNLLQSTQEIWLLEFVCVSSSGYCICFWVLTALIVGGLVCSVVRHVSKNTVYLGTQATRCIPRCNCRHFSQWCLPPYPTLTHTSTDSECVHQLILTCMYVTSESNGSQQEHTKSACTSTIKGRFYTTILSFSSAGQILETLGMRLESCTYTMWVSVANSGHNDVVRISVHLIWAYQMLLYYVNYLISYWERSYQQPNNICFNPIHSIASTKAQKYPKDHKNLYGRSLGLDTLYFVHASLIL